MATRNTLQKQRSIQMDDETYGLLVGAAEQRNISRAAIIRELIHAEYGGDRAPDVDKLAPQQAAEPAEPEIALPDTRADTFDVSGGKVRAKRSRPKLGEIEL